MKKRSSTTGYSAPRSVSIVSIPCSDRVRSAWSTKPGTPGRNASSRSSCCARGCWQPPTRSPPFRHEAQALGRLSHANVTTILDFGTAYGRDYLVMEFVPGQMLSELLDGQPMASVHVAGLSGEQLARGLQAAHRAGVVHGDIKPQNLRLTPDGRLKSSRLRSGP